MTAPPVAIYSVYPATGPETGGTHVRISGVGFLPAPPPPAATATAVTALPPPVVRIGGVESPGVRLEGDGMISAMTPALPPGTALDVEVDLPSGTVTLADAFTPYTRTSPAAPTDPFAPGAPTDDTDTDGIPDVWEEFFGSDARNAADAGFDPDHDGKTNQEEYLARTHPERVSVRYFAEGATTAPFETWLNAFNPTPIEAVVHLTFFLEDGTVVRHLAKAPGGRRVTLNVNEIPALQGRAFGLQVEADEALIVNRTMTLTRDGVGIGAAAERGVGELSTRWGFAEGATTAGLQTYLLLANPADEPATVTVGYLLAADGLIVVRHHVVPAHARYSILVNDESPQLVNQEFGISLTSTVPIVAERSMYAVANGAFETASTAVGVTDVAPEWFFAEGFTAPGFDTYLLLSNPTGTAATVEVRYLPESGDAVVTTHHVAPYARVTIGTREDHGWEGTVSFGMHVRSTNETAVVAERATWWTGATPGAWEEGHGSTGVTGPQLSMAYAIADGVVGGVQGASTYVLLANPGDAEATIEVRLLFDDETPSVATELTLPAGSRGTVDVGTLFPEADGRRFSVFLQSADETPFVAEQSIYWTYGTGRWLSGVNLPATSLVPVSAVPCSVSQTAEGSVCN